jgi:hypothetical protein
MQITVATTSEQQDLTLADELRLVKAALLYADKVTLASPATAMVLAASRLMNVDPVERHRRLLGLAAPLMDPEVRQYVPLVTQRRFRRQFPNYVQLKAMLDRSANDVADVLEAIGQQAHMPELRTAISAGLLEIDELALDPTALMTDAVLRASGHTPTEGSTDAALRAMVARVGSAVAPGSLTYPMFDDGANRLAEALEAAGQQHVSRSPAAEVGLAGHFVGRMPAFPDATIAEIIDVRRGLQRPLVRFRGALAGMARELEEAPWDPEFRTLADSMYRSEVEPALLDLEEKTRDSGALSLLRHAALSGKPYAAAGATVAIALTGARVMPDIAALAFSVGSPLAAVAAGAAEMVKEQLRLRQDRDRNRFLFLYETNRGLERTAPRR